MRITLTPAEYHRLRMDERMRFIDPWSWQDGAVELPLQLLEQVLGTRAAMVDVDDEVATLPPAMAFASGSDDAHEKARELRQRVHDHRVRLGRMNYVATWWPEQGGVFIQVSSDDDLYHIHRMVADEEVAQSRVEGIELVEEVIAVATAELWRYDCRKAGRSW